MTKERNTRLLLQKIIGRALVKAAERRGVITINGEEVIVRTVAFRYGRRNAPLPEYLTRVNPWEVRFNKMVERKLNVKLDD
ncbi:MAG: hypothetical protein ABIK73_08120 [candidate division WOR-3 bacterium]